MLDKLFPPRKSRPPRAAAGVRLIPAAMATVAALLGLKAVALAEDIAEAPAMEGAPAAEHAEAVSAPAAAGAEQCAIPSFAEQAGLSPAEVQVLQALGARREALDSRASQLETQDGLMSAAEQRLDQRLSELRQLESTVNQLLGQLDEAQAQRVANLVDVYQRMRAKDAAAVFDGLDDGVLVQVASRMRQANLAEIMGNMQPTRARHLTEMLAELSRPPSSGQDLLQRTGLPPAPTNIPAPPRAAATQ
jgi:flagellar motility protein MotE (MotC chaperone)